MDKLGTAVSVLVPVFAVVAIGYLAGARRWLQETAISGLSTFVFNFAIPALLFRSLATRGMPGARVVELLLAYYVPAVLVLGAGVVLARSLRADARTGVRSQAWGAATATAQCWVFRS